MAKFDNAKVGDRVWSSIYGWGVINDIYDDSIAYRLKVIFDDGITVVKTYFTVDGKHELGDKYPTLFWNEFHIPTDEEDKKPFNLVDFLRDNLEPREFRWDTNNIELHFSHRLNKWKWTCSGVYQSIGVVYFRDRDNDIFHYIVDTLNENKVTLTQLKKAYLELGWL